MCYTHGSLVGPGEVGEGEDGGGDGLQGGRLHGDLGGAVQGFPVLPPHQARGWPA